MSGTTMSSTFTLDQLPVHILSAIVGYAHYEHYELPTWRLRSVCRSFREAVESVLRPMLSSVQVTTTPALGNGIMYPVCEEYASENEARHEELLRVNKRFADHLQVYRAARTIITDLTVEVRDDDKKLGWELLAKYAGTLQTAEIHVWDSLWRMGVEVVTDSDDGEEDEIEEAITCWRQSLEDVTFTALTKLTLVTCARLPDHLGGILQLVPCLRDLTVGCHWTPDVSVCEPYDYLYFGIPDALLLETLAVYGDEYNVQYVVDAVLPIAPQLRQIVIDISEYAANETFYVILERIAVHEPLERLAIHGTSAPNTMQTLSRVQEAIGPSFPNLNMLAIEQRYWDGRNEPYTPLLDDEFNMPTFPSLAAISFVDDYDDRKFRVSSWSPPADERYHDVFEHEKLCELATKYPTLGNVRFWAGHPDDPFDLGPAYDNEVAEVKCHVIWEPGTTPPHCRNECKVWDPNDPALAWLYETLGENV